MKAQQKHLIIRFFTSTGLFVVCLILLALISYSLVKEYIRRSQVNQEITHLESEIVELEEQSSELKKLAKYLKTESFIEKEARMNLGLSKPGEGVMIIPESSAQATPLEQAFIEQEVQKQESISNPKKWMQYFFPVN